jgi:hypothetical protein
MPDTPPPEDPLGLGAAEHDIRINELNEQLKERGMGSFDASDDCPPEVREQFLSNVLDYESAPLSSQFAQLVRDGIALPAPDTLDDAAIHAKLWEIINSLAARDVYLYRTDHLSDRALYEHLWGDTLREQTPIFPAGSGWINHIDLLGGCSDEDIELGLRYYDDQEQREHWAKDFPEYVIPPHEDPPYDRDRHLPKAPLPAPPDESQDLSWMDELGLSDGESDEELGGESERQAGDE